MLRTGIKKHFKYIEVVALILIISTGFFLRFYKINLFPLGLYPDIAANGLDGLSILNGNFEVFFQRNAGREGLFMYIVALFQLLFTHKYYIIYGTSAFIGSLTIIVNYFVIKRHADKTTALISTFLLATSFFHVLYSRLGYRTILMPLFVLLVMSSYFDFVNKPSRRNGIIWGVITGLGFYTYIGYRTFFIGLLLTFLHLYIFDKKIFKSIRKYIYYPLIAFFVTFSPWVYTALRNSEVVFFRSESVLVVENIPANIVRTLMVFGIRGDMETQYNLSGLPVIPIFLAILFWIGIGLLLKNIKDNKNFFILITLCSQLGLVIITDRVPHMLRAVSVSVLIFFIISKIIVLIVRNLEGNVRKIYIFLSVVVFSLLPFYTYDLYFNKWVNQEVRIDNLFTDYIALGEYLKLHGDIETVIVSDWWHDGEAKKDIYVLQTSDYILENKVHYTVEYYNDIGENNLKKYIIKSNDPKAVDKLKLIYPQVRQVDSIYNSGKEVYKVYSL